VTAQIRGECAILIEFDESVAIDEIPTANLILLTGQPGKSKQRGSSVSGEVRRALVKCGAAAVSSPVVFIHLLSQSTTVMVSCSSASFI